MLNPVLHPIDSILVLDLYFSLNGRAPSEEKLSELVNLLANLRRVTNRLPIVESRTYKNIKDTINYFHSIDNDTLLSSDLDSIWATNLYMHQYFLTNELQLMNIVSLLKEIGSNTKPESINHSHHLPFFALEGLKKYKTHSYKERNKKLIKIKKEMMKSEQGELYCEACDMSFSKTYGLRGENFIEAHHEKPLFTYKKESKTMISDLKLLCSNCHSMVHRTIPWLSFEDLKKSLRNNTKVVH